MRLKLLAVAGISLLTSACAGGPGSLDATKPLASATPEASSTTASSQTELEKATEYWGKEYGKNPRNLDAALSYAKNLKAMGRKGQALSVLQQASMYHASDRKLNSEYGRLALEMDQVAIAKQLLEAADDPANPDWRVISARATVLAKQGHYRDAIPHYEKALTLAHDQPSIMNNLALAYTMNGEAAKAEELLRKAAAGQGASPKVRQNLALVLGLQGKYDESKQVASADLPAESAAANADYMRKLVKLDPKRDGAIAAQPAVQVAKSSQPAPSLKPAAADVATATWDAKVATAEAQPVRAQPAAAPAAANPLFKPSTR
jgi:Flp pilus assembly protein TadD